MSFELCIVCPCECVRVNIVSVENVDQIYTVYGIIYQKTSFLTCTHLHYSCLDCKRGQWWAGLISVSGPYEARR